MAHSKLIFMGIVVAILLWVFIIVILLYVFTSKFLMRSIKIVSLDKANTFRHLKLAESIKEYLSSKTAVSL